MACPPRPLKSPRSAVVAPCGPPISGGLCKESDMRVMLFARVVVGRWVKLTIKSVDTKSPIQACPGESRGGRRSGGQQGGPEPADRRLPGLGGRLRRQSSAADRRGREGGAQGGPCRAVATAHGTKTRRRRLRYLQEHGAGADLPGSGGNVRISV
jgi:hypothetical protein